MGSIADEGGHFEKQKSGFLCVEGCLEIVARLGLLLSVIWLVLHLVTHYR